MRLVSFLHFFPNFFFSWTLFRHSVFVRFFHGPIFETDKLFENLCTQGASLLALRLERTGEAPCGAQVFEEFFSLENGAVKSDKS